MPSFKQQTKLNRLIYDCTQFIMGRSMFYMDWFDLKFTDIEIIYSLYFPIKFKHGLPLPCKPFMHKSGDKLLKIFRSKYGKHIPKKIDKITILTIYNNSNRGIIL